MDKDIQFSKSDLLSGLAPPTASQLSAQTWAGWANEHKVAIGATAVGVAALSIGGVLAFRAASNKLAAGADGALASRAEVSLVSAVEPVLAKGSDPLTGSKLAANLVGLEARAANPTQTALGGISGQNITTGGYRWPANTKAADVLPDAYSWPSQSSGLAAGDSRALLAEVAKGNTGVMLEPSVPLADRVQALLRTAKKPIPGITDTTQQFGGAAIARTEAGGSGMVVPAATQQAERDLLVSHSIHDHGAVHTSVITQGAPHSELLGMEIQKGTRPQLEEIIVDVQRSTAKNPFQRHMPAIGRFEMPALNVRRRPEKW